MRDEFEQMTQAVYDAHSEMKQLQRLQKYGVMRMDSVASEHWLNALYAIERARALINGEPLEDLDEDKNRYIAAGHGRGV